MPEDSYPPTPEYSFNALAPMETEWRPILHASNQVVLYNPTSHALAIRHHGESASQRTVVKRRADDRCPYCHRSLHTGNSLEDEEGDQDSLDGDLEDNPRSRVPNYFQLLQVANEMGSVPPIPSHTRSITPTRDTPRSISPDPAQRDADREPFRADSMAEGYFKTFFQEECRLGMGANGSVYLCQACVSLLDYQLTGEADNYPQHVLDGNPLGSHARHLFAS